MGEKHLAPSDSRVTRIMCDGLFMVSFQKNVHSTKFVTYFCEHVLPNLSSLTTLVEGLDIQLEVSQSQNVFQIGKTTILDSYFKHHKLFPQVVLIS